MESKQSKNFGKRVNLKQGDTIPVQFLQLPDEFIEYEMHSFQENGRWTYVPCVGDNCPMCADESQAISRTSYRFAANVFNLKEKKVQILEGPKDLASRIFYRYERGEAKFLKRTFEITKFPTQPVSYDVSIGEEPAVKTTSLTLHDLDDYIVEEAKRYYGDELPEVSALDAEDELDDDAELDDDLEDEDEDESPFDEDDDEEDEEAEDDGYTEADLKKLSLAKLKEIVEEELELDLPKRAAKPALIEFILENQGEYEDEEEEDEELEDDDDLEEDEDLDEDEDEDDEGEEEDEPPARTRRASGKASSRRR